MVSELERTIGEDQKRAVELSTQEIFRNLIQKNQYVGEVYSIGYETALVQIHDRHRMDVGGIPSLSFLIATRVNPEQLVDYKAEDSSVILLRVMDAAPLPNDFEAQRIRVEAAQRASGEDIHWDSPETMDSSTHQLLSYAGVKCRVIGTFFLDQSYKSELTEDLILRFGSDLSNYYPNRGLKVYKPNDKALSMIVNYRDPERKDIQTKKSVVIGQIRYASTNRSFQGVSDVEVSLLPGDLLGQKTALFGMTRTGKSNTVKIIAKSVYELRHPAYTEDKILKIGQIIFDPNGEYANENAQDNNDALKNIWKLFPNANKDAEVSTYGLEKHKNDPDRKFMKINFFEDKLLQVGKEIINASLADETAQYFKNFIQVVFLKPEKSYFENENEFWSELHRYTRRKVVYQTLLKKAGFKPAKNNVNLKLGRGRLFSEDLCSAMAAYEDKKDKKKEGLITNAAVALSQEEATYDVLIKAFEGLFVFLSTDAYNSFNIEYAKSHKGEAWADSDLERLLEMFMYPKGTNLIGKLEIQHTTSLDDDYAEVIYQDLVKGKLVIVDQSSGNYEVNRFTAQRIMERIFTGNQSLFRGGAAEIPEILIYIEEAHNILPSDKEKDLRDIWVRTAKEGAKYHIGMVYSTQEVSSIQKNILKNTANFFIGHLNNTDETKELCKYYDFDDFESSIRRAQDKGFLRVKTLSNLFVIPVQIRLFEV